MVSSIALRPRWGYWYLLLSLALWSYDNLFTSITTATSSSTIFALAATQQPLATSSPSSNPMQTIRSFTFSIEQRYAALTSSLPQHTSVYNKYPREELRTKLPGYLSAAVLTEDDVEDDASIPGDDAKSTYLSMGRPIHVLENEMFELKIINNLQSTGLSIHFHGFELLNNVHYDGVVGLTQCPVSPKTSFSYNFVVNEEPGTYWYHTHSGPLGIDSHNMIKGPLIVHANTEANRALVDRLNDDKISTTKVSSSQTSKSIINYRPLLSYENERILFFSDGFTKSDTLVEMYYIAGLNPPVQMNDDDFVAAAMEYEFGTLNGKLREVIHVQKGTKYIFRLINGGVHFGFRFSIDSIQEFSIEAADSTSVVLPGQRKINEVILHNAERYDIEIEIPNDIQNGSRFWIRIDTLEARSLGFENGIRGILHVVDDISTTANLRDNDILDPIEDIVLGPTPVEQRMTINCYSALEKREAVKNQVGGCLPITVLKARNHVNGWSHRRAQLSDQSQPDPLRELEPSDSSSTTSYHMVPSVIRTVDFDVSPPPQHAHFVRIDYGHWYQHVDSSTHMMRPDFDPRKHLHPHTAVMDVPANSLVIIIWRSRSIMDHPMHLHGYKMEILDIFLPDRFQDCTMAKCELPDAFNSTEKIYELERIPVGSRPIKDTFIMPAGGAVATRIHTREPAPWLAHCHMEVHREDGMAFVMNVGNYFPPKDDSWLPDDFPDCDTPFLQSHTYEHQHCDCYINEDAVLGLTLFDGPSKYKCSRSYLCMYEQSQIAVLHRETNLGGFEIASSGSFPGYGISLIIVIIAASVTICLTMVLPKFVRPFRPQLVKDPSNTGRFSLVKFSMRSIRKAGDEKKPSFWLQFQALVFSQMSEYRPGTVNPLRVVEVAGLGILAGILFIDVGNKDTATGFGEKTSLLFFSTTLWSQTRMYPAIGNYFEWTRKDVLTFKHKQYDLLPVFLSRIVVVNFCEGFWPYLFVLCAFPLAAMFGSVHTVFKIGFLLSLNNVSYIALGGVFGTVMPTVSLGMIAATLFAQTTVICAGFFTELPGIVGWIRYISPIFYTFSGIVKTAYNWNDTYKCVKGQSMFGPNECLLEESVAIDDYQERGINVAKFGDTSSHAGLEITMLFILFGSYQLIMLAYHIMMRFRNPNGEKESDADQTDLDDKFDEKIMDFGRQSLFLRVDNTVATLRQTMRESTVVRDHPNNQSFVHSTESASPPSALLKKREPTVRHFGRNSVVSFNDNPSTMERSGHGDDALSTASSANLSYATNLTAQMNNTVEDKSAFEVEPESVNGIGSSTRNGIGSSARSISGETQEEFLAPEKKRSGDKILYDLA